MDDEGHNKILTWLLEIIGTSAAVVFGTFSVLSWKNSEVAKAQANAANIVAFGSLCAQVLQGGNDVRLTLSFTNFGADCKLRPASGISVPTFPVLQRLL